MTLTNLINSPFSADVFNAIKDILKTEEKRDFKIAINDDVTVECMARTTDFIELRVKKGHCFTDFNASLGSNAVLKPNHSKMWDLQENFTINDAAQLVAAKCIDSWDRFDSILDIEIEGDFALAVNKIIKDANLLTNNQYMFCSELNGVPFEMNLSGSLGSYLSVSLYSRFASETGFKSIGGIQSGVESTTLRKALMSIAELCYDETKDNSMIIAKEIDKQPVYKERGVVDFEVIRIPFHCPELSTELREAMIGLGLEFNDSARIGSRASDKPYLSAPLDKFDIKDVKKMLKPLSASSSFLKDQRELANELKTHNNASKPAKTKKSALPNLDLFAAVEGAATAIKETVLPEADKHGQYSLF